MMTIPEIHTHIEDLHKTVASLEVLIGQVNENILELRDQLQVARQGRPITEVSKSDTVNRLPRY